MFCPGNGALSLCPAAERVWEWGKGRRCHDASCRDAWCQAVWGLPWLLRSSPEAVEGTTSGPSSRDQRPPPAAARGPLANRPPAGRPQLRSTVPPEPPPGFQKRLAVDRQTAQPRRSRKASAQRSPGAADQSTSFDPYIPPSEDKFCRGAAAMLSVAAALLCLEGRFSYPFTPCFALSAPGTIHVWHCLTPEAVVGGGAGPRGR